MRGCATGQVVVADSSGKDAESVSGSGDFSQAVTHVVISAANRVD
jgi:hypothetical protein